MLQDSQGRNLWIMDELGGFSPVRSQADIASRQRGRGLPDWWLVAKTPDWTPPEPASLLSLGLAGGAGTGHTKIGAGHKPQGYDEHGRYTGPRGGSVSLRDGQVRLYEDGPDKKPDAEEPEADAGEAQECEEAAREVEGVLVADSGRIMSDAGGLFGGFEVRGPVTPPQKAPAEVTWRNDDPNRPDPKPEELKPQMREAVGNLRTNNPELDSFSVNSGKRSGDSSTDPHADGRAVDINKVNEIPVKDLKNAEGAKGDQARQAAKNMVEQAKNDPNVNQVIGPKGGWEIKEGRLREIKENDPRVAGHQDHYHINVFRK